MAKVALSPEQIAEYKEAFNLFDEDGDGKFITIVQRSLKCIQALKLHQLQPYGKLSSRSKIIKTSSNLYSTLRAISTDQIGTVMRSVGLYITEARLKEIIKGLNQEGNGKTDINEFLQQMEKELHNNKNQNIEKELRDAFRVFDTDQDGIIPAAELKHYLVKLGEALTEDEVDQMLKEVDQQKTGQIKCDEFVKIMLQK